MGKVVAGFFSFTEITDPSEHHAYNEWHQLDHLPEQYPLDGIVYGQRWVCSPACRDARVAASSRLGPTHYVTLYLMAEPLDETLAQFMALGEQMHELGRFHLKRRSHLAGPFALEHLWADPRVAVSAEAVPYRPHRGIYVTVGPPRDEPDVGAEGVAGRWTFEDADRRITVFYLDDDPLVVAERLAPALPEDLEYAGPFETITPWEWSWFEDDAPGSPEDDLGR